MKFIFLALFSLNSIHSYAQSTCLLVTTENAQKVFLCDKSDADKFYYLNCLASNICFWGSSKDMIEKINSDLFSNGDGGIGEAKLIDQNGISFIYGDVGSICEHKIEPCI